MDCKYYFIQLFISLLYLNNALGRRVNREVGVVSEPAPNKPETDELDRAIISETGCKYVVLAKNKSVFFSKKSGNLVHTTLAALLEDETLFDQNQTNFEMHFAVRSASDLQVLLFTRRQYVKRSRTESDYKIGLGTRKNQMSSLQFISNSDTGFGGMMSYEEETTNNLLSTDKYEKFYLKLDDNELKYGKQCARHSIGRYNSLGPYALELVQFGFFSNSEQGAKILYDCPKNFAGCPCDWRVTY